MSKILGHSNLGYSYFKIYGDSRIFRICRTSLALECYNPFTGWTGGFHYSLRRVVNETISAGTSPRLYGISPSYYLELSISGHFEAIVHEITEIEAKSHIDKLNMLEELSK